MNPLDLIKFVQSRFATESEQLHALAALSDAPDENFVPMMSLPKQSTIPSFKIGDNNLGSILVGQNYNVPGPVPGQQQAIAPSVGQLLIGEDDGTS